MRWIQKKASLGSVLTPVGDVMTKSVELLFGLPLAKAKPLYDTVMFPMSMALMYQSTLPHFLDRFPTESIYTRTVDPGVLLSFAPYRAEHFPAVLNLTDEASLDIQALRRQQEENAKQRLLAESGSPTLTLESMFKNVDAQVTR